MAKKEMFSPVKTGSDPRKEGGTRNLWLKIESNSYVDATILVDVDEIVACEQCAIWLDDGNSPVWVYTGPEDPMHDLGVDKRYRAYLPVLVDGEAKVWSMGKQAHSALLDIADANDEIKGLDVRLKRTGAGLATRYSIVPKGSRRDVSKVDEIDVISLLGPLTPNEVKDMLVKKFEKEDYEDFLSVYRGKGKTTLKTHAKKAAAKGEVEDLDNVELV